MTSPPPPRRPLYVAVAIAAVILTILFVGIFFGVRSLTKGDDTTQNSTATTSAQQDQAPDYPDFPSPPAEEPTDEPTAKPTPSASSTPKIPKDGDKRGCPTGTSGKVDTDDPFCKERNRRRAYDKHFADNPAYDCPDDRNRGLGIDDQDQFTPCVNGALRLELVSSSGSVTLYSSTAPRVSVEHKVSNKATAPKPGVTGVDWVIRQSTFGTDNLGEFYRLRYFANPDLRPYAVYSRIGATGDYKLLENPNSYKFYTDTYYQVVVFWCDPELPKKDAPLPPFFSWGNVEKPFSS